MTNTPVYGIVVRRRRHCLEFIAASAVRGDGFYSPTSLKPHISTRFASGSHRDPCDACRVKNAVAVGHAESHCKTEALAAPLTTSAQERKTLLKLHFQLVFHLTLTLIQLFSCPN